MSRLNELLGDDDGITVNLDKTHFIDTRKDARVDGREHEDELKKVTKC